MLGDRQRLLLSGERRVGVGDPHLREVHGDLLVGVAPVSGLALGIDREDHRGDVLHAVMPGGLGHCGRMAPRGVEIAGHGGLEVVLPVIGVTAAGFLRMGANVDGADFFQVGPVMSALVQPHHRRVGVGMEPLDPFGAGLQEQLLVQVARG